MMDIVNGGQEIPTLIIGAVGQKGKTMPEYIIKVTDQFVEQMKAKGMSDEYELIRCKDCKYWLPHSQFGFDENNEEHHQYCERLVPEDDYYAFTRNADDFCSRAKRKEE
jgi:hypothetical protein